jgi:hypothetical protein
VRAFCASHKTFSCGYLTIKDSINPSHYTQGDIECIEAIEAALSKEEYQGYLRGQCLKYLWRLGMKDDPNQELGKAGWYLERLMDTYPHTVYEFEKGEPIKSGITK